MYEKQLPIEAFSPFSRKSVVSYITLPEGREFVKHQSLSMIFNLNYNLVKYMESQMYKKVFLYGHTTN
jgi:hypothetical protein